jgi:hypothetical protein
MACPITGKVQHATREEAEAHQKKLVWKNHVNGEDVRSKGLNVYPCPHVVCGAWHVGHSEGPRMPLVYHYTIGQYLEAILEADELRPPTSLHARTRSEAICEPNPLLWFSWNPDWEHSVTKDPRPRGHRKNPPTGRAVTEIAGDGLIRFGAPATVAKLRWNDYLKRNPTHIVQRDFMALRGNPVDWLATDEAVSLDKCKAFEVWYGGAWVAGDSMPPEDFEAYIESRERVYEAAWLRLWDKAHNAPDGSASIETLVTEDDAEKILLEDFRMRGRERMWKEEHKEEIRKFAATVPLPREWSHGGKRRKRRK